MGLPLTILYDYEAEYDRELGIFTYPFNIIVNRDRIVEEIICGTLDEKDFESIIDANKAAGVGPR